MRNLWPALAVIVAILAIGLGLAHSSCARPDVELVKPGLARSKQSAAMYVAVRKAKDSLKTFIERYQHPQPDDHGFGVQAAFDTPQGPEHIWIHLRGYDKRAFTGVLADEPNAIPGKHRGDLVTVKEDQVTDWIYASGDKQVGGFTIEAAKAAGG